MKGQKGISTVLVIIIILAVASIMTLSIGYWTGFLREINSEKLEITYITSVDVGGSTGLFEATVRNTGKVVANLEYVIINGTVIPYFCIGMKSDGNHTYLAISPNSQVEISFYLNQYTQYRHAEIRLLTVAGSNFSQILAIPKK